MITSLEVENFRGIERLSVSGLGRVNLIVGKNNAGKTALMEAAGVVRSEEEAGSMLAFIQRFRIPNVDLDDFDATWRPLFRGGDAERGLLLRAKQATGGSIQIKAWQSRSGQLLAPAHSTATPLRSSAWTLEYEVETSGQTKHFQVARQSGDGGLKTTPTPEAPEALGEWFTTGTPDLTNAISHLSRLKQQGSDNQLRELMNQIDARIEGLEILAPTGAQASIFVRVRGEPLLLPLQMMGDGVQRCFDIAVSLAGSPSTDLSIDEIENGLHHSVLEPVWVWLARISVGRKVQIFATTHSEECVQAACRAFSSLNDDGLRVIRLDRQEHQTVATVYDRNLVEAAERMGIEIRG